MSHTCGSGRASRPGAANGLTGSEVSGAGLATAAPGLRQRPELVALDGSVAADAADETGVVDGAVGD
jgi:hypothetical protein